MSMGYSGLIYAVIVAAWAGVLIPRWLRRNEEIDQARETDAARGVRVLQRQSGRAHNTHRPRGSSQRPVANNERAPDRPRDAERAAPLLPTVAELDERFAFAATRRRRALTTLLGVCALSTYAALDSLLPSWTPLVAVGVLGGFLVMARRAVIRQARLRRAAARAAANAQTVAADDAEDAVHGAEDAADAEAEDDSIRVAVLDEPEAPFVDPDAWDPVDVPSPTYMSKPAAPRIARTIDLTQPGSWTSGRLDPASSIEPSHDTSASPSEEQAAGDYDAADDLPEHRRAVGD